MAQRRMFSKDISGSDAFIEMPVSTQLLYFHLGMEADDDGFVGSPKKVSRMIGCGDDDLKVLASKRFILVFPSGVIVIKHWKLNNYIQSDRYKETRYLEEKKALTTKENGAYTECIQNLNKMETQIRLGKVRLDKNIISADADYKSLSERIYYESDRTFKDKKPSMSFLMGKIKQYGEGAVLGAMGQIRESGTIPKDPAAYLSKVFLNKQKESLKNKMKCL